MKLLAHVCLLTVLYFACTNATKEEAAKSECMKKLAISPEEFNKGDLQNTSDKMKCFWDCYGKAMGFGNSDNPNIDELIKYYESSKSNLPLEDVKKTLTECKSKITGDNDCDKAYSYIRCVYGALKL